MAEETPKTDALDIGAEFPPVSTEAWEEAIKKDLKGADYEKKLVWKLDDGIAVRPYYRRQDLAGLDAQTNSAPGEFPFARGAAETWEISESAPEGGIRADRLHEAGATAVQELGYALAEGVDALALAANAEQAAQELTFIFAIGPLYLVEIAKLRAARTLWAQAVAAFGVEDEGACRMKIYARTSRRDKSVYDRYSNLLRATTEALSAAVAGCDRLYVEPFGFSERLAVNVQRVLREEAHVSAVADPAGGAYAVEALTDALAREAWALFQKVEAEGGYAKALQSGSIERSLQQSRAAKRKAAASRRTTLVGVNNYPDLKEKTSTVEPPGDGGPFPAFRLAEPFERIRQRTERHALKTGRWPKALLLRRGDVKMRTARANFSLNFLGCAGFDIAKSDTLESAGADLIVLCASDAEYPELAREMCPAAKAPVIVAGNPKDQLEELKAAGVAGFIHIGSDAVATLTELQDRLGMEPLA
jgi:methylmalonyl-CoA mutase